MKHIKIKYGAKNLKKKNIKNNLHNLKNFTYLKIVQNESNCLNILPRMENRILTFGTNSLKMFYGYLFK